MLAPQRLYRTADGVVVGEGDERAAYLLAVDGGEIPAEYEEVARQFLTPPAKKAEPAANKQAKPAPNKRK